MDKSTVGLDSSGQKQGEWETRAKSLEETVTKLTYKLVAREGEVSKLLYADVFALLSTVVLDIRHLHDKLGIDSCLKLLNLAIFFWLHERKDNAENKRLQAELLKELTRRQNQDKKRTEKRTDRLDRPAFQEAVKANIDYYATVADAVEDLQDKPQR